MLAEIADVIGPRAAALLLQHFGGREIRVPVTMRGRTFAELVQAIGEDAAIAFCRHFSGEVVYITASQRLHTEHNRRKAAELRAKGMPWHEIAKRLTKPQGYSVRGARKLLEKAPSHCPVVADLFGFGGNLQEP